MAAPKALLCLFLLTALYLAHAPATTAVMTDIHRLSIFSNLQHDKPVNGFLAPYPAGVELVLTCNMRAVEKPQWWEWDSILCPNSTTNRATGINTVKFHISKLGPRDHARRLTCASDNLAVESVTVTIYVISDIPELQISYSTNDSQLSAPITNQTSIHLVNKKTTLTCGARGLDRHLNLCWFKNNKEIGCQRKHKSKTIKMSAVSITVSKEDNGSVLVCRPKLRESGDVLGHNALKVFEKQFDNSKYEVTILHTYDAERADALLKYETSEPQDGISQLQVVTSENQHPCVNPSCETSCVAAEMLSIENDENDPEQGFLIAKFTRNGARTEQQNRKPKWTNNQDPKKQTEDNNITEQIDQKQHEGTVAALMLVFGTLLAVMMLLTCILAILYYKKQGAQGEEDAGCSFQHKLLQETDEKISDPSAPVT